MFEEKTSDLRKLKLLLAVVGGLTVVQMVVTDASLPVKAFHSATLLVCLEGILPFSLFGLVAKALGKMRKEDQR
jgi:hypothetical protein